MSLILSQLFFIIQRNPDLYFSLSVWKTESPLTHVLIEFGLDNKLFGHKIYNKTSFFLYIFDYV